MTNPAFDYYESHDSDKPLIANSAANVIYFTNRCNLACTYCYEDLVNRPPQILTEDDIVKHIDSIIEREGLEDQTVFVLFGGEATLEWDNVEFFMKYAFSKKQNVHFNLETNGIRFLSQRFLKRVKNNFFYRKGYLSIDISFDGIGNKNRIFHNGMDSTKTMLKLFKQLNQFGFNYRIRYTIHKLNIDYLYKDMSLILKTFSPKRLITSVAWSELSEEDIQKLFHTKDLLRKDWINKEITVPVCEMFCDMCEGCGVRKDLKSYYSDEGNVTIKKNNENSEIFKDFKDKVI
jgi:sulfatase maturation enzyme AslB (radical SAM superfamily)